MSYDMIDRFLRNNLDDDDYAKYSLALDQVASPPQRTWAGLTDEEALECWPGLAMYADCAKFWENIEAKLKEKNEH